MGILVAWFIGFVMGMAAMWFLIKKGQVSQPK